MENSDDNKRMDAFQNLVKGIYEVRGGDAGLQFHLWPHTEQVLRSGSDIVMGERLNVNITKEETYLLRTAIIAHDVGNILGRKGHEDFSIDFVKTNLPYFGYDGNQIGVVSDLIKATEIPQNPKTKLEEIMCDADMSLMGLNSWDENIGFYRKELGISDLRSWYEGQKNFLGNHEWFTKTAKYLYDEGKENNIYICEKKLCKLK